MTNYFSATALSDVLPLNRKGVHAALTQWTNKFSLYQNLLMSEWFGWQISEHRRQLFRSQCVEVTSYWAALRRSEAQSRLAGCFYLLAYWQAEFSVSCVPVIRTLLKRGIGRICKVSPVCTVIQNRLWKRTGPWKCSRWKQNETYREWRRGSKELCAACLISTIPEVRGRSRAGFPLASLWLVMSSNCSHLWLGLYRDWKWTAGASLGRWLPNHETAGLPPKGHSAQVDHTQRIAHLHEACVQV